MLNAARGLTCTEAENVFAKSLVMDRKLDLGIIIAEKEQLIRRSQILGQRLMDLLHTAINFSTTGFDNAILIVFGALATSLAMFTMVVTHSNTSPACSVSTSCTPCGATTRS